MDKIVFITTVNFGVLDKKKRDDEKMHRVISHKNMTREKKKKKSDDANQQQRDAGEEEEQFSLVSSKIALTKRPLSSKRDTERIENPFHSIRIRDDVLTRKECDAIANVCATKYRLATSRGPKFGEAWRKNKRTAFVDKKLAQMLWEDIELKTLFIFRNHRGRRGDDDDDDDDDDDEQQQQQQQQRAGEDEEEIFHSLNENFRVYEYTESHHFGPHVDERVRTKNKRHQKLVSTHTMLLYLAGEENGLKGGKTYFLDNYGNRVASVTPKAGRVCFFRHGEEMCEHEGEEIFAGKKIVLRSDVFKLVDE